MEIALGYGCVKIQGVKRGDRIGLGLQQTCEPHEVGSPTGDAEGTTFVPDENKDVIIWIDNMQGGLVLLETLSSVLEQLK